MRAVVFFFLGSHLRHMEVLGVESELQPLVYTTATVTQDPSHVCNIHHSSQQCRIFNPRSEARDQICILMGPSEFLLTTEPQRERQKFILKYQLLLGCMEKQERLIPTSRPHTACSPALAPVAPRPEEDAQRRCPLSQGSETGSGVHSPQTPPNFRAH